MGRGGGQGKQRNHGGLRGSGVNEVIRGSEESNGRSEGVREFREVKGVRVIGWKVKGGSEESGRVLGVGWQVRSSGEPRRSGIRGINEIMES